jgi:hypothetical protein
MSFFTDRDLERLANLKANWRQLYCGELNRLLNEHADNRWIGKTLRPHQVSSVLTITPWSSRFIQAMPVILTKARSRRRTLGGSQ